MYPDLPPDIALAVDTSAESNGLPASFLKAVAFVESGFDPNAISRSPTGQPIAYGLFQLIPSTYSQVGAENYNPLSPAASAMAGGRYFRYLADLLKSKGYEPRTERELAGLLATGYNGGPARMLARAANAAANLPAETEAYIPKVLNALAHYSGHDLDDSTFVRYILYYPKRFRLFTDAILPALVGAGFIALTHAIL